MKTTALCAAALMLCGCARPAADARPTVGVSLLNLSNEFIVQIDKALRDEAEKQGVRLVVSDAQRSAERQVQHVENFIAQRVDAIILNPCEFEASSAAVEKARAAGIPIVNVNSETRATPDAFAGSHDEESARLALEFLATKLGGKGRLAIMQGFLGQAAQLKRDAGAKEVLRRYPGLEVVAEQPADWDRAKAVSLMENWLQAHGTKIQAVFAQNDEMGMGAVLALEQAGRKKDVFVVSIDAIADAQDAVKAGRLDATVFQDGAAQARAALHAALAIVRKQPFEKETWVPFRLVTR